MKKKFWKQYTYYPIFFSSLVILSLGIFFNMTVEETSSVEEGETACNTEFEEGTDGEVVFCKGEDWALPSDVERSEEGRLIVGMSPLDESGDEIYNSLDWHGYSVTSGWGELEGDNSSSSCDGDYCNYQDNEDNTETTSTDDLTACEHEKWDGTANYGYIVPTCSFDHEPTLSDYLERDGYPDWDNDGEIRYSFVHSLYSLTEKACVFQCWERTFPVPVGNCDNEEDACCISDSEWVDVLPWNVDRDEYGICVDDAREVFTSSTLYMIENTSAGHNGSRSPNWLGEVGVPTIFMAFEKWCNGDADCDLQYVKNAYNEICTEEDCDEDDYRNLYDNFAAIDYNSAQNLYVDSDGNVQNSNINEFLQDRREYSYNSYSSNEDANVYAFFNEDYIKYQCRFFQRMLATINKFSSNYKVPFTLYLNSESGNLGTLPNTILGIQKIDQWAHQIVRNALQISGGIRDGVLAACDLREVEEEYEVENLQSYLGDTPPKGIWAININNGGRVFRQLARLATRAGLGVATHNENATMSHHFLQHFYPFIKYDQDNWTYQTCLNELNCEDFIPDESDAIMDVEYPPFDSNSWHQVQNGQRPFDHLHVDMTQLHKDINTVAQYRMFRMNALGALALGANQIKLTPEHVPGQGYYQELNCESDVYTCDERKDHIDSDDGSQITFSSNSCNIEWECIEDYHPYSFMQWIGKNIGTSNETAPEAYCALFSMGEIYTGDEETGLTSDFYERIAEIWNTNDWEMQNDDTGVWAPNYNGEEKEAIRSPYISSLGRFCRLDFENGGGTPSRGYENYYGSATPAWDGFPYYSPYDAKSLGGENGLLFSLSESFIESYEGQIDGYTIKVIFAAGEMADELSSEEDIMWTLKYYDGDDWNQLNTVALNPSIMGEEIYTATFRLEEVDFSNGGDENGNYLQIQNVSNGDYVDFLLIRIIPIISSI